ncbi:LIM domain profile [Nakaseomyces glabratus]
MSVSVDSVISGDSKELPVCVKCKEPITTGHAYELGYDRWHIECFACHKCDRLLTCDSDFLVLGTGALICFDCSDSCKSCGKKIDDLAIILSSSNEARTYDEKKRKLLEKKNLPKIPQITDDDVESPSLNPIMKSRQTDDDMKKSSSSLEIPKRSVNRPRSAIRDAQIMKENGLVKSTSDSIITHYLDVDETKENESKDVIDKSSSRKNSAVSEKQLLSPNRPAHLRKSSLSAPAEEFYTATEFQSPLRNNIIRSPLRDQSQKSPFRGSKTDILLKSPKSHRRGMVLDTDDENSPESFNILDCFDPSDGSSLMAPPIVGSSNHTSLGNSESPRTFPTSLTKELSNDKLRNDKSAVMKGIVNGELDTSSIHSFEGEQDNLKNEDDKGHSQDNVLSKGRIGELNLNSSRLGNSDSDSLYEGSKQYNSSSEILKQNGSLSKPPLNHDRDYNDSDYFYEKEIKREIMRSEMHLRKLRHEVDVYRNKKKKYQKEIDEMKLARKELKLSLDNLQQEWNQLRAQIDESIIDHNDEDLSMISEARGKGTQPELAVVASVARTSNSKPRFWKLFSSSKETVIPPLISQPMQFPMQAVNYGINSTSAMFSLGSNSDDNPLKLDISHPVLKNVNEFDDLKLISLQNTNDQSMANRSSSPITSDGSKLYGSSLAARAQFEGNSIPFIIRACISFIESSDEFLTSEGIYRKSGSQLRIEELEKKFADYPVNKDSVEAPPPRFLEDQDIHTVTGVLKRKMTTESKSSERYFFMVETIRKILLNIPESHFDVLRLLSKHVCKVSSYSSINLMTIRNLALIFAPNLLRDYTGMKEIEDMREKDYLMTFLFTYHEEILH